MMTMTREDKMQALRDAGVQDPLIGLVFDISKQRVGTLLGPNGHDRSKPAPSPAACDSDAEESAALDDLPAWLAAWRAARGWSQTGMARQLGVTLSAYGPWERGTVGCSLPILLIRYLRLLEGTERKVSNKRK